MDSPLRVVVEPFVDEKRFYKMTAKPRGFCLIINNVDYDSDKHEKRSHSDSDADKLERTFTELGFDVKKEVNLTASKMLSFLVQHSKKDLKRHDALVVIVLTHGHDSDHLIGIDNNLIKTPDILWLFNNKNCPDLIDKPKLFFIEACRGKSPAIGVRRSSADGRSSFIQPNDIRQTPNRLTGLKKYQKHPSFQDMLISYSTVPDCSSIYNDSGSWYCTQLNRHLREDAAEKNLEQILMDVDRSVRDMESGDGIKQTTCYENWGLYKKVYFNPGYYEIAKDKVEPTSK